MQSEQSDVQMESVVDTDSELSDEELEQILKEERENTDLPQKGRKRIRCPLKE